MVAWNQTQGTYTVSKSITVDQMPLSVKMAWQWQGRAINRIVFKYFGVMGYGGYEEEARKAKRMIDDIYERRLARYLSADCTCRPDSVTACAWCRTPAHIKAAYTLGAE